MLMYTSCGWFFDELSGIETTQIIQYAARAVQLYEHLFGETIEPEFLERLSAAKSNIPENQDGRVIYEKFVKPAIVDREKVAAHYALSSLFETYPEDAKVYCYKVQLQDAERLESGRSKIIIGRARITSEITQDSEVLSFGALHIGDHFMNCGVRNYQGETGYGKLKQEMINPFTGADFPQVIRILDRHFGESTYSLRSIFHDDQRHILNVILKSNLAEAEALYRQLYSTHASMMRFVSDLGIPLPKAFSVAAEFALNSSLRAACEDVNNLDFNRIHALIGEAKAQNIQLDGTTLGFTLRRTIRGLSEQLLEAPDDIELMKKLAAAAALARSLPFEVNIWRAQNHYYRLLQKIYPERLERAVMRGEPAAREWVERFATVGRNLGINVEIPAMPEMELA
jgi:hypothetical protein